jgi:hypothetical protein
MDERRCFIGPFNVARLTERQHTDAERFRAMRNALSAQITKLSVEARIKKGKRGGSSQKEATKRFSRPS